MQQVAVNYALHSSPSVTAPLLQKQTLHNILQVITKTRKSWKTLKGHSEAVWPPYIEAAMLAGLQEYQPNDSRETRILGRFPMRNRFISDYIYRNTGKYRSAKQVGSRLQQLRDTTEGRELIDSLKCCYFRPCNEAHHSSYISTPRYWATSSRQSLPPASSDFWASDSSSSSCSSPISPSSDYTPLMPPQPEKSQMPRSVVYIDVLPDFMPQASGSIHASPSGAFAVDASLLPPGSPRPMRNIDPTLTFVSPSLMTAKSSYIVLFDGAPIHSEDTQLQLVAPTNTSARNDGSFLYGTTLVPNYWETICRAADPTQYTILQDVFRAVPPSPSEPQRRPRPVLMFSALYKFQYPTTPVSPPSSSSSTSLKRESPPSRTSVAPFVYPFSPLPFSHVPPMQSTGETSESVSYSHLRARTAPGALDVDSDDVNFDEFTVNIQDSPKSISTDMPEQQSYCFPPNLSNYLM